MHSDMVGLAPLIKMPPDIVSVRPLAPVIVKPWRRVPSPSPELIVTAVSEPVASMTVVSAPAVLSMLMLLP